MNPYAILVCVVLEVLANTCTWACMYTMYLVWAESCPVEMLSIPPSVLFPGMDSSVKNMVTSLRAVGELQNPAIRDRHWEQLMQATQVSLCMVLRIRESTR